MMVRPSRRRLARPDQPELQSRIKCLPVARSMRPWSEPLWSHDDATTPTPRPLCLGPRSSAPFRVSSFLAFASCVPILPPSCEGGIRAAVAQETRWTLAVNPSSTLSRYHTSVRTTASPGDRYFVAAAIRILATSFFGSRHAF
ncbi:hypothetical protein LX32DRAFT_165325 [Colletotrichum zoysiae]|uniref:Uncharacterized protein n=1 Tax=Colletotrichum zoysiae TaxID=1216348 RepID=A0AAD9LYJ8_9PEZI|nr:hypothetical protein LX32DRAFT_165325 [Colletotrichum zoysiae]